jgi:hypothetical protein
MIGDAALCLAAPNCWWDNRGRGCYPGQAPAADRCAAWSEGDLRHLLAQLPMVRRRE